MRHLWRDDLVTFLIGCSFTFEQELLDGGVPVRHTARGRNVPMYRTSWRCRPAGRLDGPRLPLVIAHEPGHMLITDSRDSDHMTAIRPSPDRRAGRGAPA